MTAISITTEFDLQLTSGRIRARRVGPENAPLVLFIHGLSAHLHSFDFLIEQLVSPEHQLVAVDLRGRGCSETTPEGSYGLDTHSRDVLEIASLLGAEQFDLVGWSMGALVGIGVAVLAAQRLRRLVLIDHAGNMDTAPVEKITRGLDRLDLIMDQPSTYLEAIRLSGSINPWSAFWDNYYRYELQPYQQSYKPGTSKMACLEDLQKMIREDYPALWKHLTMPVLLIRCLVPIAGGFIVPEQECVRIKRAVPHIEIAELDYDHYIVMVNGATSDLIRKFLNS